jgi:Protein of unknown function (DUF742)
MTPRRERALVRPHVVTGGRAHPTRRTLELLTLVTAVRAASRDMSPEKCQVVEVCTGGVLSIAEVAGHLCLPVTVVKVLISDLVDTGHLLARAAEPPVELPDEQLLLEVLHGLCARL